MYPEKHLKLRDNLPVVFNPLGAVLAVVVAMLLACAVPGEAQSSNSTPSASPSAPQSQEQQDQVPVAAGGPTGDSGTIAVPKKAPEEAPPPPPQPKHPDIPEYSMRVDVPVVTINAQLLAKDGRALNLPLDVVKQDFRVWEDGVPQHIQSVTKSQAPITAVMLIEFAATDWNFMMDALNASYTFASELQPQDWVAVEYFDVK